MPGVSMNFESADIINGAWMPTVVFSSETGVTRQMLPKLLNLGILMDVFYGPFLVARIQYGFDKR